MEGIYQNLGAEMEFISETRDYNPAEFHDNFGHNLPRIVTVNQGFYGEIIGDTFDRGQVIRIHTVSRQPRVVAKSVQGIVCSLYSIPLTYPEHLCVVSKHGKAGKEQSLSKIIQNHQLPVFVQFPKQRKLTIGSTSISTNQIPAMELTQNFDEMYLLGNFIIDGVISHEPVHVPLYLSNLRLSLVTAIKGQPLQKWTSYQQEITNACKHFHYNDAFGNPEIAVYRPHDVHDDTLYEKLEPATYTNITALFPRKAEPNIYQNTKPDKPKKPTPVVLHKPPMSLPQGDQGPPTLPDRPKPPSSAQPTSQTTSPTYENNIPRATASPFRPSKPKIEFTTDKLDFYVSDFITSYEHELPHVVMVNQGYGSFAKEQVLNIQAVSRQERVIVKPKDKDNKKVYSFPLTYPVGAQVISKTGALGKVQSLNEILSKCSLPVTVKLHSNKTMTVGSNQKIQTEPMGAMELVQVFDETYLLGNFILDGKMADEVTYIPKYLRPLKLSLVNGIEGTSAAHWYNFTAGLERDSNTQEYDMEYGNPEIAEYNDDFLTSRDHACVEPIRYCNFAQMFQPGEQGISSSARSIPVDDTYDQYVDLTDACQYPAESSTDTQDSTDKHGSFADELANKFKAMKQKQDGTAVNKSRPGVLTKPGVTKPASEMPKIGKYARKKEQNTVSPSAAQDAPVSAVKASTMMPTESNTALQGTNTDDIYENETFKINIPTTKANKPTTALSRHVSQTSPIQNGVKGTSLPTVTCAEDVKKLTINEVGEYLKLLNLNKYVETFKSEMVDGTFLVDMDEELLKDDFDFKRIEAKRLLRFASEGHVPR